MARQLVRLPAGNQQEALEAGRRHSLTAAELRGDLALCDRGVLEPAFVRLVGEALTVAELTEDFLKEIHLP